MKAMALDQSFARSVSRKSLADWTAAGASFERALQKLLGQAHGEVQTGKASDQGRQEGA